MIIIQSSVVNCDLSNWQDFINKKIIVNTGINGLTTDLTLNNVYIRNSVNGLVQKVTNYTDRTVLTTTDRADECKCTNILEQVYNIYTD